jgi:hypothetical protein
MGCDPLELAAPPGVDAQGLPTRPNLTGVTAVGDVDGDGCDEVAYRANDAIGSSLVIAFGYDAAGTRCGGHAAPAWLRIADREKNLAGIGLALAIARAGKLFPGGVDYLAVSANALPINGVTQSAVLLYDVAALKALRPASGAQVVGALADGLVPKVLVAKSKVMGFGRSLAGGIDLNGDGLPELAVGASGASLNEDGVGAVLVFSGAAGLPSDGLEPWAVMVGDAAERASFGFRVSIGAAGGSSPPFLLIGAPLSYRTGTQNGTAFSLPLGF